MALRGTWFALIGLALAGCSESHVSGDDGGALDAPSHDASSRPDSTTSVRECDGPSGCVLRPASCCGACGTATPSDMIALPVARYMEYTVMVCEGVGCPDCAGMQDPLLLATCQASRCTAVDLHTSPLTECATSADCVLAPIECCACGLLGEREIVSYNPARGSIAALTCDPDADCPPCVPDFGGAAPFCDAGRCTFALPGGG